MPGDGQGAAARDTACHTWAWGPAALPPQPLPGRGDPLAAGINEMDPPLCGAAVISHTEVSETDHSTPARRTSPMQHELRTVAIDLAKKVFHLVGTDTTGKILWRKRLTRHALMPFIAQLPPVLIGIEACGGAHYWARRFREHGHEVKLM